MSPWLSHHGQPGDGGWRLEDHQHSPRTLKTLCTYMILTIMNVKHTKTLPPLPFAISDMAISVSYKGIMRF